MDMMEKGHTARDCTWTGRQWMEITPLTPRILLALASSTATLLPAATFHSTSKPKVRDKREIGQSQLPDHAWDKPHLHTLAIAGNEKQGPEAAGILRQTRVFPGHLCAQKKE